MNRLNPPEGLTFSYQAIDMLVLLGQRDNPISDPLRSLGW
jgi:hypothetical protein